MTRYVGLGRHCESTFQLRRITADERANYFDWLDLDHHALVRVLEHDFEGFLRDGEVVPDDDGKCMLDQRSGVKYYHDFAPGRRLSDVQAKFTFLADRWRAMEASSEPIVYVLQDALDEMTPADAARVESVLRARRAAFDFRWLRRTPPPPTKLRWSVISEVPGRWQGNDVQWDLVLS
jgi:hypothetical protein